MKSHKRNSNKTRNNKQEKVVNKEIPDQKDHQEVQPSKKDNIKEKRKNLQDETQDFMYHQSSKFSTVSRSLILGMFGTIWVLTYTDGTLFIPNRFLLCCLIGGLLFLLTDVIHYFWDSMSYHDELYKLDSYSNEKEFDEIHESRMDYISLRSHRFIIAKFIILLLSAIFFAFGLILKIKYVQT